MNYKQLPLRMLLATCMQPSAYALDTYFDQMLHDMDEHMRLFEEHMHAVRQELKGSLTAKPGINVSIDERDNTAVITFKGISNDIKEATFKEGKNLLDISTQQGTIKIQAQPYSTHYTTLGINIAQTVKQTAKDNDKDSKTHQYTTRGTYMQTVDGELELGRASIEYDKASSTLTVTLPMKVEKEQKIPVTVKQIPVEVK